ncbi:AP-4 complex subunit mu isoform X1 [Octopus sinensis]|uniref:AP-4 complex subunit mu isoform X1 n=1 Tax=Octopus sinensis TaxID=2607531 RepID=A0A7E6F631_9MOLL|nr:AP-4 complex subunit mu isoform X1 [Octopus sinensis]
MYISEIFITTTRGDILIHKKYRFDLDFDPKVIFLKKLRAVGNEHLLPHFKEDDVTFCHIKRNGLFIMAVTTCNMSPIFLVEFLTRFFLICKDFCGVVSEDAIRANVLLIYEILNEILEFGYIQLATTDKIKPYIQSDPVLVLANRSPAEEIASRLFFPLFQFGIETRVAPSSASSKPVVRTAVEQENRKNEIFVDVIEKMIVVITNDGLVSRMDVTGNINVKSFLSGNPVIKLAVNEDLTLAEQGKPKDFNSHVTMEQCSFHQCVRKEEFNTSRCLILNPPIGEFSAMTYRLASDPPLKPPFRLQVQEKDFDSPSRDTCLSLQLLSHIPENTEAVNIVLRIPVPGTVSGISQQLIGPDQTIELKASNKQIVWNIKKFPGGSHLNANLRLISNSGVKTRLKDIGHIVMEFEASGYTCSGIQIRYLRVFDRDQAYVPYRWIRYITVSDSYVFKL